MEPSMSLRVFISSTMTDLANERREVVDRLRGLGLTPVNAEDMLPDGRGSWPKLKSEIETSHLLMLLLGERYGWIPDTGPGSADGLSITHMEFNHARDLGVPVLPFSKKLQGSSKRTKEVKKRDAFRAEVAAWHGGLFRGEFDLAHDLADKVVRAVVAYLAEPVLKARIKVRDGQITPSPPAQPPTGLRPPTIDPDGPVLVAGAGMSVGAGFPTALALSEVLLNKLGFPGAGDRHRFSEIAAAFEATLGRAALVQEVRNVLQTSFAVPPTGAHRSSVRKFSIIITTNYDTLFEQACQTERVPHQVLTARDTPASFDQQVTIVKIDGSIDSPDTLVLSDADGVSARSNHPFWNAIHDATRGRPLVVIGHSIRDANTRRFLEERDKSKPGIYVTLAQDPLTDVMLRRFGLTCVEADADTFMRDFERIGMAVFDGPRAGGDGRPT
jgi:hypothetical protein